MILLLVAVAGGLGAAARFVLDGLIRSRTAVAFPMGTLVINVSGSLVLGFVTGLTLAHVAPAEVGLIVGSGFLGGYTTFSTASVEAVRLVQDGRVRAALSYGLGTVLVTAAVAGIGLVLGLGL